MNTTDIYDIYGDYDDTFWHHESPAPHEISPIDWVAMIIHSTVFLIGVPGNALVVWVTIFGMKRTVNTVWFLNLAVADLLCCLALPVSIMETILGHWPLGQFACKFIPSLLLVNMYASVLLLTVISMDRCAMVLKPVWCQNNRTLKKAYVVCAVIWLLAFVMSTPSFIFRHVSIHDAEGTETCGYNYILVHRHRQKVENFIASFRLLMGFVIPFLVITVCYGLLLKSVREQFSQSTKTLKVILTVIIGFFICWLPYHVVGIIMATNTSTSALFKATAKIDIIFIALAFVNSCINPVIYVLMGQDFKNKFKRSISGRLKIALEEDTSQSSDRKSKSSTDTKNTEDSV
ncbi:C5a anaphylatoxin chemotactic receptor 1-like [Hyperolius riggenbachi]|uniref:C5a anaphylatoxin chemotactic receptor 1-like n=1 Tax=Hyperolius riggenbachi TaxID=752182 RepID=UPI0035A34A65